PGPYRRHDDFQGRTFGFVMLLDGDAAAVVTDADALIDIDFDEDIPAIARQGFVDAVIDQFIDQMVQPAGGRVADVHARALANVGRVAENLDVFFVVIAGAIHQWSIGFDRRSFRRRHHG